MTSCGLNCEIRSSIETTCNHEVDHKVERREYEVALEYYRLIGLMRQMGARPTRTQAEEFRERSLALKVDHSVDVEMLPGYSFYTRLLEDVRHADRREREIRENSFDHSLSYNRSPGEFIYMAKHVEDKGEDIRTRIERLRGLRPPLKEVPAYDERKLRARALTREGIELALARQAQREAMDRA